MLFGTLKRDINRLRPLLFSLAFACITAATDAASESLDWTQWSRPVDQPVFTSSYGNNHDAILFAEHDLEYPYQMIISDSKDQAYLWRSKTFSWSSANWELDPDPDPDPNYQIHTHPEYDDGVNVDGTYYIYEGGYVFTYAGALSEANGHWDLAGTFPNEPTDDVGVYFEDGVFHLFGEYGQHPSGRDGTSLAHFTSETGLGDWELVDTKAVDPNPDGGNTFGVGDPTIAKIDGYYYIFCDEETTESPYKIVAWRSPDLNGPFEYLGTAIAPRSDEEDDWDNYRIQDADIVYVPELSRYVIVANMQDRDGNPGGGPLENGFTRVIGVFYSDATISIDDEQRNAGFGVIPEEQRVLEIINAAVQNGNADPAFYKVYGQLRDLLLSDNNGPAAKQLVRELQGAGASGLMNVVGLRALTSRGIATMERLDGAGLGIRGEGNADSQRFSNGFWTSTNAWDFTQDGTALTPGYATDGTGVSAGYEQHVNSRLFGGVAFGYDILETEVNRMHHALNTFSVSAYGRYGLGTRLGSGHWYIDGLGVVANSAIDTASHVMDENLTGSTDARQFFLEGRLGSKYAFDHPLSLNPYLSLRYAYSYIDGYQELSDGALDRSFSDITSDSLQIGVGAKVGTDVAFKNGFGVSLNAYSDYARQLSHNTDGLISYSFATFEIPAVELPDDFIRFGGTATFTFIQGDTTGSLYAGLDMGTGTGIDQMNVNGGLKINF